MSFTVRILTASAVPFLLAACGDGAREVDYSPQRGYSSDIASALNHGPTASRPGMEGAEEPLGAMPWEIPDSRQ